MLPECTDEELMVRLQQRDVGAPGELYDRHHRPALALAYRVVSDQPTAEEIVQETFLAVWRRAATYRQERGAVRTWLLTIARHRAIDRIRRTPRPGTQVELSRLTSGSAHCNPI